MEDKSSTTISIKKQEYTEPYDVDVFDPILIAKDDIPRTTEAFEQLKKSDLGKGGDSLQDQIVKSMLGVITKVYDDTVEVKIAKDAFILFPIQLFEDQTILEYGQPLNYQIIKTASGFRYQKFSKLQDDNNDSPEKKEILKILDSIPLD